MLFLTLVVVVASLHILQNICQLLYNRQIIKKDNKGELPWLIQTFQKNPPSWYRVKVCYLSGSSLHSIFKRGQVRLPQLLGQF